MRKNKLINLIMILLFIGTTLSIFHLRNHRWNYVNLLGHNRRNVKYAAHISLKMLLFTTLDSIGVEKIFTSNEINNEFKTFLKATVSQDSIATFKRVRFLGIDGYKLSNAQSPLNKSFLSSYSDDKDIASLQAKPKNIANIEYQDRTFVVQLKPIKLFTEPYFIMTIFDLIVLLLLLILALHKNPQYQTYLKSMYFVYFLKIVFFFLSLFSKYFHLFYMLSQLSDVIIHVIFILAFYKTLAKYHILVPRLLMIAILINLWLDTVYIPISIYLISLTLIIFSERGVKRKIYIQNIFFLLLLICSIFIIIFLGILLVQYGIYIHDYNMFNYDSGFLFSVKFLSMYNGPLFSITYFPVYILFFLVIMSLVTRILKIKLLLIEYLYYLVLKLYLVLFSIFFTFGIWFTDYSPQLIRTIGLVIFTTILYLIINRYLKLFPFINPVRFNLKKMVMNLLNASYNHTSHKEYSEFFFNFLKKLQPKAKISIINKNSFIGDVFPHLQYTRLEEVLELNSHKKLYLNLDLELLDETAIGRQVEDFNNSEMPHLLYPIYNNKEQLQAVIAFGKYPGIYWQKSLAEAIYKLVEVFSGFYLNILVQERYLEQGKAIVKEQEEKVYNQKIAELKTQQNEELKAEKKLITESIEYAALIQKSLVPQAQELDIAFDNYFVIWQQRDIVGGDLYWANKIPNSDDILFSVIDCTGHGIPGALMSVTANSSLERISKEHECYEPSLILNQMHQSIGTALHQSEKNTQQDGMDMSIIKYNKKSKKLHFAGANHNLILIKKGSQELIVIKGDRYSIGGLKWNKQIKFNDHELQLERGDTIYLFSDGIVDQPFQHSETKLRRLGTKTWYNFLVEKNQQNMDEIKTDIEELIAEMIELSPQRDDICIVGIRVK